MRVNFIPNDGTKPERQLAEAELVFDGEPLLGLKLVGFGVWREPGGRLYVTLPSRAFGVGGKRQYFSLVRPLEDGDRFNAQVEPLKTWVLRQWEQRCVAEARKKGA